MPPLELLTARPADVERLLTLRPDVLHAPAPRNLRELAERLDDPGSVAAVLHTAELPVLQVAEALQALGGRTRRLDLTALLDGGVEGHAADSDVERSLRWLADRALVRLTTTDETSMVEGCEALALCLSWPLGLGPSVAEVHATQTAATLHPILARLGLPRQSTKAAALATLVDLLRDPEAVRGVAATAPPDIAAWLARRAGAGQPHGFSVDPFGADLDVEPVDDEDDDYLGSRYDPVAYRLEREATGWAAERGLVVPLGWGGDVLMPAEVALALRGPTYRAPFLPAPPDVPTRSVPEAEVQRESAAAATSFADRAVALLDLVTRSPLPTLKSGGVGARELTRLAKVLGTGTDEVRLVLELAAATGLVRLDATQLLPSPNLAAWRDQEPGQRFVALLRAWWRMGGVPTTATDDAGKSLPALRERWDCLLCAEARRVLLSTLGALGTGAAADLSAVSARALWSRPLVHAEGHGGGSPFALTWREAELLGVVARGALSPLGRALVDAGSSRDGRATGALADTAAALLPGVTDDAVFGNDLTVLAAGAPSARVARVLDVVADRESTGGAVVWRVTAGSVRRALDQGATVEELEQELLAIARSGLPQPLQYLLHDVGRRHGSVRVREVASCLRGDDPALLAEIAADRSLRRLGLRVLAPTVLSSAADARTTVEALRTAGYLPVVEDGDGNVVVAGGSRPLRAVDGGVPASRGRPPAQRSGSGGAKRPAAPDVAALAAALVRAGDPGERPPASRSEALVRQLAPDLPGAQARLLGHAVDTGTDVVIEYVSASGAHTRRRVGDLELTGGTLQAWCHLRQDERFFTLSRIASVRPVASSA